MSLTVSIVIVSRYRPKALRRCLIGISQLDYAPFEVIVVADPASCTSLRGVPQAAYAKVIAYDAANISVARNLGINSAAGEIVAFIDDDAVPEPTWLKYLIAPFSEPETAAAGGYVRGRNGISMQYRARSVDQTGKTAPIDIAGDQTTILVPTDDRAIKTEGTNMAVRRSVLQALDGFDPRFRYFLDETDLNMRLAARGWCTAIVPLAQVHHGFAASAQRHGDRSPRDLLEIGASWAVFLGKHCAGEIRAAAWDQAQAEQYARACSHMVTGALEPRDVRRLMSELKEGFEQGESRQQDPMEISQLPAEPFRPNPQRSKIRSIVLSGRIWHKAGLRQKARTETAAGNIVTLILLSPTALFHRVRFATDGYWEQVGGLFGKSDRNQRMLALWSFRRRVEAETVRVGKVRGLR